MNKTKKAIIMAEAEKVWENLSLSNNFIFQKVMQNQELCKKVLSEILGVEISRVEHTDYEKTIDIRYDSKAIRLDVYVKDEENTVYNIEIQNVIKPSMPKRGRYYQGLIDLDLLEKGCYYDELNKSIVIFICTFDYYGLDRYKYTFNYKCEEEENLEYGDETTKIVINTYGKRGEISDDLKDFLHAINGQFSNTDFSDRIKVELEKVKRSDTARREFMTLYLHEEDIRRESLEKGRLEGIEEGIEKGIEKGIEVLVVDNIAEGKSTEVIIEKVMKLYDIDKEKALYYYEKYKK